MCVKEIIKSVGDFFKRILSVMMDELKGVGNVFENGSSSVMDGLKKNEIRSNVFVAIMFGVIFGSIFCYYDLEMSKDAWFYVFSALSQTLAVFIAFGAMVLFFYIGDGKCVEGGRDRLIDKMNIPYSLMIVSIVFSIILLTFGQTNDLPNWITNDFFKFFKFLKYFASFFTITLGILGMTRCAVDMIAENRDTKDSTKK